MTGLLTRFVAVLQAAAGEVPVVPVVVEDVAGQPQLPAVTWARDGGATEPVLEGNVERPAIILTVWHPTSLIEAERVRERLLRALWDADLLAVPPDPPQDDFIFDLVTTAGQSGKGAFSTAMTVLLGVE